MISRSGVAPSRRRSGPKSASTGQLISNSAREGVRVDLAIVTGIATTSPQANSVPVVTGSRTQVVGWYKPVATK